MSLFALQIHGLVKHFGSVHVLNGLDLSIKKGEIYGLLGANGAGKSTTIRLICGLLQPDAGTGQCLNTPLGTPVKKIGYMPQTGNLYDDLTVLENLCFFADLHGIEHIKNKVHDLLIEFGLNERVHQRVSELSGGWRQRLAFVLSILHQPQLLLLDEPSTGLDPRAREKLWASIRKLSTQLNVAVLITTHYIEEASRCDRIGYLSKGLMMVEGVPHDLATKLNLITWHISLPKDNCDNDAFEEMVYQSMQDIGLSRVSNGWRLVGRMVVELPSELSLWINSHYAKLEIVNSDLSDTLTWLTSTNLDNKNQSRMQEVME
jgi:ABC-2 type transport system ATP-binding protein